MLNVNNSAIDPSLLVMCGAVASVALFVRYHRPRISFRVVAVVSGIWLWLLSTLLITWIPLEIFLVNGGFSPRRGILMALLVVVLPFWVVRLWVAPLWRENVSYLTAIRVIGWLLLISVVFDYKATVAEALARVATAGGLLLIARWTPHNPDLVDGVDVHKATRRCWTCGLDNHALEPVCTGCGAGLAESVPVSVDLGVKP